ncbi:hypothetical protein HG537_0G00320 [Torulaspora globosa]|uniref:Uncharacterized protein n=1 Tax=Torulaspora globosa TaxID=48254 RepID=A0A7H9HWZ4_9SACH|nr:hypothetical protein HG537_0G00320 [Torulaspora sp. CBS 2947]
MAFKSFKYKFYSKGYHSAAQKSSTSFFDSSYQYLRQNQGLVNLDTAIPQSNVPHLSPYPVLGANVNFNLVDDMLLQDAEVVITEDVSDSHDCEEQQSLRRRRSNSIALSGNCASANAMMRRKSMGELGRPLFPPMQKDVVIDQALFRRYYSNASATVSGTTVVQKSQQATIAPKLVDVTVREEVKSPWEEDTEPCLNVETFLDTHITEINRCYEKGDFNMINSLYQALKRNGIVPPLETYSKVLESLSRRDLDKDDLDYKMSELLTCYQDMIVNKLKPSDEIYNTVLGCLFKGSILAFKTRNPNGADFYKIASELFQAIDTQHRHHQFSKNVLDHALLAMNLYPGHISLKTAQEIVHSSPLYRKDSFYYLAFFSYARLTNDKATIKELYDEYRNALVSDHSLQNDEFEVYSMVISGFVETGELELAIKMLDRIIIDVREHNGLASNVSLILSNFLISVSKIDSEKAYKLWLKFHKMKWIPEFSYEFYLVLMANSFHDWKLTKKIYDCVFPMKPVFRNETNKLSDYLLYPMGVESVISSLLDYALQLKDNEIIMKVLEESVIKGFRVNSAVYPFIFSYLKEIRCPDDYLLRFVQSHGATLKKEGAITDSFEFLNALIEHFPSQVILKKVVEMDFFPDLCRNLNVADSKCVNYGGLIGCMTSFWASPQTIDKYAYNLEIHSILLIRLLDFESYCAIMGNEMLIDFRDKVVERFRKLATNYRRLNLDPNKAPGVVSQVVKMIDLPEDVVSFYTHPGDWDKSYPLALGSAIRNSSRIGVKEFRRLQHEGYCFDYDTYKELIKQRTIDTEIASKALELCPNQKEMKYLTNLMVSKCSPESLNETILEHPFFQNKVLPSLTDESLLRLAKYAPRIEGWMQAVGFPERFKSIAVQAEFKSSIRFAYERLYHQKSYLEIQQCNKICPVLDVEILLKSCIRSGEFELYRKIFDKYKGTLGSMALDIQSEFLINNLKVDEAVNLIKSASIRTPHKALDLYTFGLFLQSFSNNITYYENPENTLQLANILSSHSTFSGMLAFYDVVSHSDVFNFSNEISFAIKNEILEQMLNNLHDALSLVDISKTEVIKTFYKKLRNYFRFRAFLKMPHLARNDIDKLLKIWAKTDAYYIDTFFNNMVETIYLNPGGRCLYLESDMTFHFKPDDIFELNNQLEEFYSTENDEENVLKVRKFRNLAEKLYTKNTNENNGGNKLLDSQDRSSPEISKVSFQ